MEPNYKQMYEDLINVINDTIAREKYLIENNSSDNNALRRLMGKSQVLQMVLDIHRAGKGINY